MDVIKDGLLRPLVGQTVVALSRVALYTRNDQGTKRNVLIDSSTLVFALADGRRYELMEAQQADLGVVAFVETPTDQDLRSAVDLERAPWELLKVSAIGEMERCLPWTVASITDIWQPDRDPPFLAAVILWDAARRPLLPLYTAADDLEVLPLHAWHERLLSLPFYASGGTILHHWYGLDRSNAVPDV